MPGPVVSTTRKPPFLTKLCPRLQVQAPGFKLTIPILDHLIARLEILYNKEISHLNKRRFICLSSKSYYKSGQWSAVFITLIRVHKPSSCPTDYIFSLHAGGYQVCWFESEKNIKHFFAFVLDIHVGMPVFSGKNVLWYIIRNVQIILKLWGKVVETLVDMTYIIYLPHNLINIIYIKEARKTKPNLKFHLKAATPTLFVCGPIVPI